MRTLIILYVYFLILLYLNFLKWSVGIAKLPSLVLCLVSAAEPSYLYSIALYNCYF